MNEQFYLGQIKRRDQLGLKGRQKMIFSKCNTCGIEKWAMFPTRDTYNCAKCTARKAIVEGNKVLNSYPHKDNCKCHRCRMGKGYFKGANNPMWNGGEKKLKSGYKLVFLEDNDPMHCMCSYDGENYVMEHRLVMARYLGRPLTKKETVHHKNGIRDDNRIENLELWSGNHSAGQRLSDQIEWAIKLLENNNYLITKNKTK